MTPSEKEEAISYLLEHSSEQVLHKTYNFFRTQGYKWKYAEHFNIGLWVRNKLRERFNWDDHTLDAVWGRLITEAARRYIETQEHSGGKLNGHSPQRRARTSRH